MDRFAVTGGNKLSGEVTIQGAKNSVLPILAATLLSGGQCCLECCPRLRDVDASVRILQELGCRVQWQGTALTVDTADIGCAAIPHGLMREMRSSAIFLGAMLARCGRAELSYPGGCDALRDHRPGGASENYSMSKGAARATGGVFLCLRLYGRRKAKNPPPRDRQRVFERESAGTSAEGYLGGGEKNVPLRRTSRGVLPVWAVKIFRK